MKAPRALAALFATLWSPLCVAFCFPGPPRALAPLRAAGDGAEALTEIKAREAALREELRRVETEKKTLLSAKKLRIAILGFGNFGQFLARTFVRHHHVTGVSRSDHSDEAEAIGCDFCALAALPSRMQRDAEAFDVFVVSVAIPAFAKTVGSIPREVFAGRLVVDVLSVKEHPRETMLQLLPPDADILTTHPMFGPESGKHGWQDLPFVFERTRIAAAPVPDAVNGATEDDGAERCARTDRMERFLSIWESEGCRMLEMSCKDHDAYAANSQFITHLLGRILQQQGLVATPIDTKAFGNVLQLVETTCNDSWDLFYGLYKYNQNSASTMLLLRKALVDVEWRLREMENSDASVPGWMCASVQVYPAPPALPEGGKPRELGTKTSAAKEP